MDTPRVIHFKYILKVLIYPKDSHRSPHLQCLVTQSSLHRLLKIRREGASEYLLFQRIGPTMEKTGPKSPLWQILLVCTGYRRNQCNSQRGIIQMPHNKHLFFLCLPRKCTCIIKFVVDEIFTTAMKYKSSRFEVLGKFVFFFSSSYCQQTKMHLWCHLCNIDSQLKLNDLDPWSHFLDKSMNFFKDLEYYPF